LIDEQKYFYDGIAFKWKNYTISMVEPKVYIDEYGLDDEDWAIPMEYRTKEFYISDPTYKKILRESRTLLDVNTLANVKQDIYIDWGLADTKTLAGSDVVIAWWWGIGTEPIGTFAIGTEWGEGDSDDYTETYILRTKGNLNKKWRKIQLRFTNSVVASKVRLKSASVKVEVLPEIATNITP